MADLSSFINIGANTASFVGEVTSSSTISTTANINAEFMRVSGGLVSQGSSPAPYINGFRSISTITSSDPNEGNITAGRNIIGNIGVISQGNISAVGNVSANYFIGNGSQLTGIVASSGNFLIDNDNTFSLQSDGNVVFSGPTGGVNRGLVWDFGAAANGVNSQVRQDNNGVTVQAWTEVGGGGTYAAPVNIVTNQDANVNTWTFSGQGNLTLAGNLILPGNINSVTISPAFSSSLTGITTGVSNVIVTIADEIFEGPYSGTVTISGVDGTTEANGVWGYQATDFNQFQLFTNSSLTTPVDGTSWTSYISGGIAVSLGTYRDLKVQGGNVSISSNNKTWQFDTTGNLTVPGSSSINAINDGGNLGAYLNLTPDIGLAKIAGREAESNVNFTTADWTSASYTGTQIDFVDAPQLVTFFDNNRFNVGVNQTISINGGNRLPYIGYQIAVGNAVTVYTSVTASPDPTTVTSIDFYYQLESYIDVDYDNGTLNINATGLTINIDNDQTQNPDINIRSGDDITIQAKNKNLGSESEGGDINIYAGDGASDDGTGNFSNTGGDIQIEAGDGGDGNTSSGSTGGFATLRGGQGGIAGVSSNAGSGGYVQISAGSGGGNNGNTQLGAGGGYVSINAGDSTQQGVNGGAVTISSGLAGAGAMAGNVEIITPVSDLSDGGTWRFDGSGNLTLPSTGNINGTDGAWVRVQATDLGVLRSGMTLNPAYGVTRLESWDNQNSQSFTSADWATGEYIDNGGGSGEIVFIDAPAIRSFFDTVYTGRLFYQVNGGNLLPSIGWGGGGNNITFYTAIPPAISPETVTDFVIYYTNLSLMEMDYDEGELNIRARNLDITIDGDQAVDILSRDQLRIENSSNVNGIYIATDTANAFHNWTFGVDGTFTLPAIASPSQNSQINSVGLSSGDGNGYATLQLKPDASLGGDNYLILDPTAPNHIHIRAGGTQDNSGSQLYLGGENSYFMVENGSNPNVYVQSNGYQWKFDSTGVLSLPSEGVLQSFDDTVTLQSLNTSTGNANSVYLGSGGGLGFNDQEISGNWLEIFRNGAEPEIRVPVGRGNLNIQTAEGVTAYNWTFSNTGALDLPGATSQLSADLDFVGLYADATSGRPANNGLEIYTNDTSTLFNEGTVILTAGVGGTPRDWTFDTNGNLSVPGEGTIGTFGATGGAAGANISIRAGAADQSDFYTTAGGDLNLIGGLGASNDGGGGGPGGNVNIASGYSADPAGVAGNVNILAGGNEWIFGNNGNLTTPGKIIAGSEIFGTDTSLSGTVYAYSASVNGTVTANAVSLQTNTLSGVAAVGPGVTIGSSDLANATPGAGATLVGTTFTSGGFPAANGGLTFTNSAALTSAIVAAINGGFPQLPVVWSDGSTRSTGYAYFEITSADSFSMIPVLDGAGSPDLGTWIFPATFGVVNASVTIGIAGGHNWTFSDTNVLSAPGDIITSGVVSASNYYSQNVVSAAGNIIGRDILPSGNVSATGNVYGNVFVGNGAGLTNVSVSLVGNVQGTQSNVTLVAGSYSWTFDNTGKATFPLSSVTTPVPLANLTAISGARAFVNNSNLVASGNFGAQVGSGGANTVPVWSDGTNWYIG